MLQSPFRSGTPVRPLLHPVGRTPRWMRTVLVAAGVYNLLWGALVSLAPEWSLSLLGLESTGAAPLLWACIGMIVGVYGAGYLIAARDPARHWPIVLVGLLGKIFGPIGFAAAAARGDLPWSMGATILTNDLIWWAPFAGILWHAARQAQPAPPGGEVPLEEALQLRDGSGRSLRELTDQRPTLVLLLRHAGCTFCRQALTDLAGRQGRIEAGGLSIAVVGMAASAAELEDLGARYGVRAAFFADPERKLYRALELQRGTFLQLFGPRVWFRGISAAFEGHGIGRLEGDGFQMPGAFVIHGGKVVRAFRHASAGDRPDLEQLACSLN
jgi:hypothetical protein